MLYEKYLEFNPQNCTTWIKFAELETILGDIERVRAIYELAIQQPRLDMPEIVWKSYIDFELEQQEFDKCRELYKRLLTKTQHVKVWLSYAQFEAANNFNESGQLLMDRAREIYRKAYGELKAVENNESRLMILEAWKEFEQSNGADEKKIDEIAKLMPKQIRKRRKIQTEDGVNGTLFNFEIKRLYRIIILIWNWKNYLFIFQNIFVL